MKLNKQDIKLARSRSNNKNKNGSEAPANNSSSENVELPLTRNKNKKRRQQPRQQKTRVPPQSQIENEVVDTSVGGVYFVSHHHNQWQNHNDLLSLASSTTTTAVSSSPFTDHHSSATEETLPTMDMDDSFDDTTTITSASGYSSVSSSTTWHSTSIESFFLDSPLVVTDPDTGIEQIEDEMETLNLIMQKAKRLPSPWYYASNHVLVNQERVKRTIAPLIRLKELDELAREHAAAMAAQQKLSHWDPEQLQSKFDHPYTRRMGENVAKGKTVRGIHSAMMSRTLSQKNNIIDRRYTNMGMGTAFDDNNDMYLCQIFRG